MRHILYDVSVKAPVVLLLALAFSLQAESNKVPVPNGTPLAANAFYPLPLTSVRPRGWLLTQLRIQANGLTGHIDEFWPDLGTDSGWLGGKGESWERGPYYVDGLVPLAYLLNDPVLIGKARNWVNWTLDHQRPDGSIGPLNEPEKHKGDWWPNMVMLKVLTQYQEATGDPRVIPVMERYFAYQAGALAANPLKEWAIYRWADELLSILWLYNRNGDAKLLDLARALSQQGYDWKAQFADFVYKDKVTKADAKMNTHGVNNAMALKTSALWSVVSGDAGDRQAAHQMLEQLDRYHLQPNGVHAADEHYAGMDPSQGTELCAVVEAMFSLENLISVLGEARLADRLERVAFNALPATMTADMWAHQYDQQANQVLVNVFQRAWTTNGADSNLFGLEPNYGCCTANMHQGWPKFAASLWMGTKDGGLAAIAYAPSQVDTVIKDVPVSIVEDTQYPFKETIRITVNPEKPVHFPMQFRIPAWSTGPSVGVNGFKQRNIHVAEFFTVDREWKKGDVVELNLGMPIYFSHGYHGSVAVQRGPLIYALQIGARWKKLRDKSQTADWEVDPATPWNYALELDPKSPASAIGLEVHAMGANPFTPEGTPLVLKARGRRLPEWQIVEGSAGPLPQSPVKTNRGPETLTLIPYGAAKLRITAFPVVEK